MPYHKKNPLQQLIALEHDARQFGFEWPNTTMIIEQAMSECAEITDAIAKQEPNHRVQEEIGDLLHTAISLCIFAGFDVEQTLVNVTEKFGARMKALKMVTQKHGLENLRGQSVKYMLELWSEVKSTE